MTQEESNEDDIWFGIDGESLGIHDGVIAWVMGDLRVVNRFAGEPGMERKAELVDEWINEHGHEVIEGLVAELSLLAEAEGIDGIEVPEVGDKWDE